MKPFNQYLTEVKLATAMEAMIVCAYNGGPKKDPDVLEINRIPLEQYAEHEAAAKNIASAIKTKCKPSGRAEHYGSGTGRLASWWIGRPTPKTDIYIGDVRISLKGAGGSQLMSSKKGETISTFKAAIAYTDAESPASADKLVKRLSAAMQEVVVPPSTTIGDFTTKLRGGKKVAKSLQPLADKFLSRDKAKSTLTKEITAFFNESIDFRDWFVFEAATGFTKFSPEGPKGKSISNWVLKFDTQGTVHELEKLITGRGEPTAFTRKMAEKVKFRISWKTRMATGKKTFLSLRGDILKEEIMPITIDDLIEDTFSQLSEERIDENILNTISKYFTTLVSKIIDTLKKIAKQGMGAVLSFLNMDISDVSVTGMEI